MEQVISAWKPNEPGMKVPSHGQSAITSAPCCSKLACTLSVSRFGTACPPLGVQVSSWGFLEAGQVVFSVNRFQQQALFLPLAQMPPISL